MKTHPEIYTALRESDSVEALPELTVEWNMNRYYSTQVDNSPTEDTSHNDNEFFPIESIVEPIRPTKGILKARIGEATVGDDYDTNWRARYYIASIDDKYKYWSSPYQSDGTGAITGAQPHVIYGEPRVSEDDPFVATNIAANKIVVGLENTWATPDEFVVQITTNGGSTWNTVATNPNVQNNGQIVLYYNGTGWSSTKPANLLATAQVGGVRLSVTSMGPGIKADGTPNYYRKKLEGQTGYSYPQTTGANSFLNVIEISARLEADLSDRLITVNDTFDMSEVSQLYPVGTITSNVATVSLWNGYSPTDGLDQPFNSDNPTSPYKNLLDANVKFNLRYIFNVAGAEPVQQFEMYCGPWTGQRNEQVTLSLTDHSKFFQETTPPRAMWENLTVPEIIWRICDSVGFTKYSNDIADRQATADTIPVFYVDGEQSVWEVFDELAKATQTAIYFDSTGTLQARTRQDAFKDAQTPNWTIRGVNSGDEKADLVEMDQSEDFEPNVVTVTYQTTRWSEWNNGHPAMKTVWEPESDTMVVRSTQLKRDIELDSNYIWISTDDIRLWPFSSLVNINGELIRYDGKIFVYYDDQGVRHTAVCKSDDERKEVVRRAGGNNHANHWNGALNITERGVWNSEPIRHSVDANGYSVRHIINGTRRTDVSGFRHLRAESRVRMAATPRFKSGGDLLIATRGQADDDQYRYYGTKFRFVKESGRSTQRAGIVIHNSGTNENGYYIEFTPTSKLGGKARKSRNELLFYTRVDGKNTRIGGKGVALAIAENVDYEVDLFWTTEGTGQHVSIWVNGKRVMSVNITGNDQNAPNGRFGMFTRGQTHATFEYIYGIRRTENQPEDDYSFLDRVQGGMVGQRWHREWVWRWKSQPRRKKRNSTKNRERYNQYLFDEFGPYVHEVREFDVKFDPKPVQHSRLYLTNDWSALCTEYISDPFGAKFIIANVSRNNAVIHGDETLRFSGDSRSVSHITNVLGRELEMAEAQTEVARHENQVLRRGEIETELTSRWIQSKSMARTLAEWIKDHFGGGVDGQQATIFGNPLIEVGDVVDVDYPQRNYTTSTHKYFVTGVNTSWNNGIETTLTLRRVV